MKPRTAPGTTAKVVTLRASLAYSPFVPHVIRFDSVSKRYANGHAALEALSFQVPAGEMVFVTGHSGAGKSTLLKLIALIERASGGAIEVAGCPLAKVRGGKI